MLIKVERRRSVGRFGYLTAGGAKAWGLIDSGGSSDRGGVGCELLEGFRDDAGSGEVNLSSDGMIDIYGETEEFCCILLDSKRVVQL